MRKLRVLIIALTALAGVMLNLETSQNYVPTISVATPAKAQGGPGGPGGPGGGGIIPSTDTGDHGGSRGKFSTAAALQIGTCLTGDAILMAGHASPNDYLLWGIGCAVGGPVGGGAALALFQEKAGLFTKLFRLGGFTCQLGDRVDGCAQWLKDHRIRKVKRFRRPKLVS